MYQCICIRITAMYLASGLPGPAQALPCPTHQALSRPHQAPGGGGGGGGGPYLALPGPTWPGPTRPGPPERPHTGSHTFLAAPKNHIQKTCFFWHTSEKAKTYILPGKMYVFSKMVKNGQKCSKIASKSCLPTADLPKTYILPGKMYVFDFVASIWGLESWNFSPKLEKHTFYSVKMYVFDFGAPIWGLESWNFSPKLEKHTFYSVK